MHNTLCTGLPDEARIATSVESSAVYAPERDDMKFATCKLKSAPAFDSPQSTHQRGTYSETLKSSFFGTQNRAPRTADVSQLKVNLLP